MRIIFALCFVIALLVVRLVTVILTFNFVYRHFKINCSISFHIRNRYFFPLGISTTIRWFLNDRKHSMRNNFIFISSLSRGIKQSQTRNKMFCKLAWFELKSNRTMEGNRWKTPDRFTSKGIIETVLWSPKSIESKSKCRWFG